MKNALTNLHKQMSSEKSLINNIRENLGRIGDQLTKHFPDAVTKANAIGQNFHLKKLKSKLMQKLEGKRKKFKLALESLGWGTLAGLLDSAFCGEQLDIWV
jgi:hypothetical protein